MPFETNGTYDLPAGNPVVTNTLISSTWANTTLNDIASALTNIGTGTQLIPFDQSGTSSIPTTLQAHDRIEMHSSDKVSGSGDEGTGLGLAFSESANRLLLLDKSASTTITVPLVSGQIVDGSGGTLTNINASGSTDISILSGTSLSNLTLRDISLYGANKSISPSYPTGSGIALTGPKNILIDGGHFQKMTGAGVFILSGAASGSAVIIRDIIVETGNGTYFFPDVAIIAQSGYTQSDTLVAGLMSLSSNAGAGIALQLTDTGSLKRSTIITNFVANKGRHGIYVYGSTTETAPHEIIIALNQLYNINDIPIYLNATVFNSIVLGNVILSGALAPHSASLPNGLIGSQGDAGYPGGNQIFAINALQAANGYAAVKIIGHNGVVELGNAYLGDGVAAQSGLQAGVVIADTSYIVSGFGALLMASGGGPGVLFSTLTTAYSVGNIQIARTVSLPSAAGYQIRYQNGFIFSASASNGATSNSLYIENCNDSIFSNSVFSDTNAAAGAIVRITGTNGRVRLNGLTLTGTQAVARGIWVDSSSSVGTIIENCDLSTLSGITNDNKIVDAGVGTMRRGNRLGSDSLYGTIALSAAATKVVNNNNTCTATVVRLTPTNASAATLMGSTKSLYVSTRSVGTSFTVATADGTAAAGTETFAYEMIQ